MKKHLGQHFLHQESILKRIADRVGLTHTETLIEIGPGSGALTEQLLDKCAKLICIEKDADLIPVLQSRFAQQIADRRLTLIHTDVLECDFGNLVSNTTGDPAMDYILVGNIPYYITGQILRQALSSDPQPRSIAFVMQNEVAQRIIAENKKQSLLSLSVSAYGTAKKEFGILAGSFNPPPSVDSALLCIRNISRGNFVATGSEQLFFKIIHIAFAQKRKQALKLLSSYYDINILEHWIMETGLTLTVRAEDISLEQWLSLVDLLTNPQS